MKNKVLIIGPSPYKSKGGISTVIKDMIESETLQNQFDCDYYSSYIDSNKIIVLLYSIFSFLRFIFIYKKYDIFHIHVASFGSTFRKRMYVNFLSKRKKNIVIHIHGAKYLDFFNSLNNYKRKKIIKMYEKCNTVIALSDDWKRKFEELFCIHNIVSINNGVNLNYYKQCIDKKNEYSNCFIMLGRLGQRKGTYDLIEACKELYNANKKFKVYLAGDGEVEKVSQLINSNNLKNVIEVLGWIDKETQKKYLEKVSTLVLPSYNEGLPMAILEAMAAGKYIVSTKVGAIPEVISDDNGYLINPGDIKGLVSIMENIIDGKINMTFSAIKNQEKIRNQYDLKIMHEKISDIYNHIVEREE